MRRSFVPDLLGFTSPHWFRRNRVTRMEVVQQCVQALRARRYLEIGVADGRCFCSVAAPIKVGVDPLGPSRLVEAEMKKPGVSYYAATSDDFFRDLAPDVLSDGLDVAFIDGLHTFRQAYRDCMNALHYLSPSGIVLLHDCLPANEAEAQVAGSYAEAACLAGSGWDGQWTGDVWKAIVALRANHPDLKTHVLECDKGIGLVQKGGRTPDLSISTRELSAMTYEDLAADAKRLLGLRLPAYLAWVLRTSIIRRG